MASKTTHIPAGYHAVTPYLTVRNAAEAIEFYQKVFGARETLRLVDEEGKIAHAEITIHDSPLMISDEFPEIDVISPHGLGNTPVGLHLFVEDVDAVVREAILAGAKELRPVADQFYGVRNAIIQDPFGHRWLIASQKEEVSREEMHRRFEKLKQQ